MDAWSVAIRFSDFASCDSTFASSLRAARDRAASAGAPDVVADAPSVADFATPDVRARRRSRYCSTPPGSITQVPSPMSA